MEINEKLLRQIIEEVLSEMKGSDKPVSFNAPAASLRRRQPRLLATAS
jgi:propanediol dehydratase medium subunit